MTLLSRRTMLHGLGTTLALPWLEAMGPLTALAAPVPQRQFPNRMAFLYVPNGVHMPGWTPRSVGAAWELPAILEPLRAVKDDLVVLSGLTLNPARALGDGGGDRLLDQHVLAGLDAGTRDRVVQRRWRRDRQRIHLAQELAPLVEKASSGPRPRD